MNEFTTIAVAHNNCLGCESSALQARCRAVVERSLGGTHHEGDDCFATVSRPHIPARDSLGYAVLDLATALRQTFEPPLSWVLGKLQRKK